MKLYVLLFLAFFAGMATTNATVYTVSNDPDNPAQFDNFADAHDAASSGDTIYVFGSPTGYGGPTTITKRLTIFGAGHNPDNQHKYPTKFGTIYLSGVTSENSSGTKIMGITAELNVTTNYIDDLIIIFNNISIVVGTSGTYGCGPRFANNWLIKNNIVRKLSCGSSAQNFIVSNNIITGTVRDFIEPSIIISNNLFLSSYLSAFYSVSHSTIMNNIFYRTDVSSTSCLAEYCTFNNNLSYLSDYTTFITGDCNNNGSGNLENTDPQFNSAESSPSSLYFYCEDDYRLQPGSPCINAGTDGTDIGITGGEYPWPRKADGSLDLTGMPPIPQIIEMYVSNPVVPENGTLTVKVKAHQ